LFLITGVAWLIIALIVLRFDTASIDTVGALLGIVFLIAGLNEWMIAVVRPTWKWAHIALGILFVIGGFLAFASPYDAFWALASILGFLLVLKGSLDVHRLRDDQGPQRVLVARVGDRHPGALAGLLGIAAALPGAGDTRPDLGGIRALFRGITEIGLAFQIRRLHKVVTG
jgi:uncharacterized membrane protein HdeD (DUF308 family)